MDHGLEDPLHMMGAGKSTADAGFEAQLCGKPSARKANDLIGSGRLRARVRPGVSLARAFVARSPKCNHASFS